MAVAEDSPVRFLRYHGAAGRHVRDLGLPGTFLRPTLYFQGLLAFAGMIAVQPLSWPPQSAGSTSASVCVNVHRWPARSSALYCRSPYT